VNENEELGSLLAAGDIPRCINDFVTVTCGLRRCWFSRSACEQNADMISPAAPSSPPKHKRGQTSLFKVIDCATWLSGENVGVRNMQVMNLLSFHSIFLLHGWFVCLLAVSNGMKDFLPSVHEFVFHKLRKETVHLFYFRFFTSWKLILGAWQNLFRRMFVSAVACQDQRLYIQAVTSPPGLWTAIMKPRVWGFARHHLGFLQP